MRMVSYLMSGPAHLHYLIPSLVTLRNHYSGPIEVWAYPESFELVERISQDKRLCIIARKWTPFYTGKNSQFLNKILMMGGDGPQVRLYLDADTTIHGDISPLFDVLDNYEMAITQFNDWTTKGGVIQNRVGRLRAFSKIDQGAVEYALSNECISPNGGIFSAVPRSKLLKLWYEYAWEARDIFICDESVLHILPHCGLAQNRLLIFKGGIFNCSHRYQPKDLRDEDVVIYHYHGDSNTRPDKSPRAVKHWSEFYRYCISKSYGFIDKWHHQVSNRWLDKIKERVLNGNLD